METQVDQKEADIQALTAHFGSGVGMPTEQQWRLLTTGKPDKAICILNLVKLRAKANYGPGSTEPARSGLEAFLLYGASSTPRTVAGGGEVLFAGPARGVLVGEDTDWDLGIIVRWPNERAMLSLFQDADYRVAFPHRRAAVERYRATVLAQP